jgi:very-short-patch-repair endonuclease
MNRIVNNQKQKLLRRKLRQTPVSCERKLWGRIRNEQLGHKFKRQVSIGKYIVDFYCARLKLVIEIDGATHCTDEEIKKDKIREEYLRNLKLIIKRYTNSDIKDNFSEVVYDMQQTCEQLSFTSSCPSPVQEKGLQKEIR